MERADPPRTGRTLLEAQRVDAEVIAHLPEGAKNFMTLELKSNFLATAREGTMRTECLW